MHRHSRTPMESLVSTLMHIYIGEWNYAMMITDGNGRRVTTGGHWCTCGSSNGETEVCLTMQNNKFKVCR